MLRPLEGIFAGNAARYVRQDFFVYPLSGASKIPRKGSHAFKDATRDLGIIEAHAAAHPNDNLAVLTGKDADLSVIDIDLRSGGFNTLAEYRREGKTLPLTAFYATPGGGWHLLFQYHPALRTGTNRLGPGIDFVNDGAGTPVPPTTLADGRRYIWKAWPADGLRALPAVPQWVLDYVEAERLAKEAELAKRQLPVRPAGTLRKPEERDFARRRLIASARAGLKDEAQSLAMACKPGRNRTLFNIACKLGKYVHAGILASDALMAALSDACNQNGLSAENGPQDVRSTIRSGLAKSRNDPLPKLAERGRWQMS